MECWFETDLLVEMIVVANDGHVLRALYLEEHTGGLLAFDSGLDQIDRLSWSEHRTNGVLMHVVLNGTIASIGYSSPSTLHLKHTSMPVST
jgi:hypothetical protein